MNIPMVKWIVLGVLLLVHIYLLLWGLVGFAEWFLPHVPWERVSNPDFPRWVLLLHWTAIVTGGATFILSFALQWSKIPQAMTVAYGFMAVVCAIETFGYMTSEFKYLAMAAEYITYTGILAVLYRASFFKKIEP